MTITVLAIIAGGLGTWLSHRGPEPASKQYAGHVLHQTSERSQATQTQPSKQKSVKRATTMQRSSSASNERATTTAGSAQGGSSSVPTYINLPAQLPTYHNVSARPLSPEAVNAMVNVHKDAAPPNTPEPSPLSVRTVELYADELAHLGIRADSVGIWMTWLDNGSPFVWAVTPHGVLMPPDDIVLSGVEVSPVTWSIITDDLGAKRAFASDDAEADSVLKVRMGEAQRSGNDSIVRELGRQLDEWTRIKELRQDEKMNAGRMVGIMVRMPRGAGAADPDGKGWRHDCIIWYDATPTLLARLPARVRSQLQSEVRLAADQERASADAQRNPNAEAAVLGNQVAGERPYLDVLRSNSGAVLESTIRPNPARGHAEVRFRLAAARVVEISLHDLTGRPVRELAPRASHEPGVSEVELNLEGLASGLYMVAIATDHGERAMQRLIVRD